MNMKRIIKYLTILGLTLVLYNLFMFLIFPDRANIFWITYGFTMFAFIAQIVISFIASNKANSLRSKFLGFPILYIGSFYLAMQIIAGFIIMFFAVDTINPNVAVLIYAIILGISAILILSLDLSRDEIKRVENKVKPKVTYIKALQSEIEVLADRSGNENVKKSLKSLADAFKFSDPMSSETLYSIESSIENKVKNLKTLDLNSEDIILKTVNELKQLLEERNTKCKLLK